MLCFFKTMTRRIIIFIKMKKNIQLLVISMNLFVLGCNDYSFLNNMSEIIPQHCKNIRDTCNVDINDYTDFKWDRFYIFGEEVPSFTVAETIGLLHEEIIEHPEINYEVRTFLFLFMLNNKIVYAVDGRPDKMFFINFLPQPYETLNSYTTSKFKVVNLGNEHYDFIPIIQ